jgi:chromosome segregation ATPase
MESLQHNEARLLKEIAALENQVETLNQDSFDTQGVAARFELIENEKLQFQKELNDKHLELQDVDAQLKDTMAQLNDLNHHYYELEHLYNQQNADLQEKMAALGNLEFENTQLLEQLRKTDGQQEELVRLTSTLEVMSQREADLTYQLNQLNAKSPARKQESTQGAVSLNSRSVSLELTEAKKKIALLEKDVTTLAELLKTSNADVPNGRKISTSEYIALFRKAAKVDLLQREIEDLSLGLEMSREESENVRKFLAVVQAPSQSVEELRQLMLKESDAVRQWMEHYQNYQNESLAIKESSQKQILELKEEFDELALLFETTNRELEQVKSQLDNHGALRNKSSSSFQLNSEAMPIQELTSLNKLVESLETDRKALTNEIVMLKQKYESLLSTKQKELDLLNSKIGRMQTNDQIAVEEYKNRVQSLEFELKEVRSRLQDVTMNLQQAAHDVRHAEKRVAMLENERTVLIDEQHHQREMFDNELYHAVSAEQQRARDQLNFKLKDLRSSFDGTMNEMLRKQSQLEQMLDESERLLVADRESFHMREQQLLDELRFVGSGRWSHDSHRYADIEQERMHLESKLHNLHMENRQLRKSIDTQGNQFLKDRYDLLNEIANLKADLENLEYQLKDHDSNRIIKTLQEQKSVLLIDVGTRVPNEQKGREVDAIRSKITERVEATRF